jgi:Arc/MetJ-type ribon-helix-helix transcriptional regulator
MTKTISVQLPDSLLVKVDALAPDRDDFFRRAIEEKIAQTAARSEPLRLQEAMDQAETSGFKPFVAADWEQLRRLARAGRCND